MLSSSKDLHNPTGSGVTSQDAIKAIYEVPSISAHEVVMNGPIGNEGDSGRYSLEELREKHARMKEATTASMLLNKNQSQSTVGGDFNAGAQSTSVSVLRHTN